MWEARRIGLYLDAVRNGAGWTLGVALEMEGVWVADILSEFLYLLFERDLWPEREDLLRLEIVKTGP